MVSMTYSLNQYFEKVKDWLQKGLPDLWKGKLITENMSDFDNWKCFRCKTKNMKDDIQCKECGTSHSDSTKEEHAYWMRQ
jgi:hypothetical protein